MRCPYCGSRRISDEYTAQTYDLPDEWVAVDHVRCGKCGATYTKTIRENLETGERRVITAAGVQSGGERWVRPRRRILSRVIARASRGRYRWLVLCVAIQIIRSSSETSE